MDDAALALTLDRALVAWESGHRDPGTRLDTRRARNLAELVDLTARLRDFARTAPQPSAGFLEGLRCRLRDHVFLSS
jgi:hypothetical protein